MLWENLCHGNQSWRVRSSYRPMDGRTAIGLDLDDPRLNDAYLRVCPGGPEEGTVVLVGVVHDHPSSQYRAQRVLEAVEPTTLALELPPLALPLFEEYATESSTPPRPATTPTGRTPRRPRRRTSADRSGRRSSSSRRSAPRGPGRSGAQPGRSTWPTASRTSGRTATSSPWSASTTWTHSSTSSRARPDRLRGRRLNRPRGRLLILHAADA